MRRQSKAFVLKAKARKQGGGEDNHSLVNPGQWHRIRGPPPQFTHLETQPEVEFSKRADVENTNQAVPGTLQR